MKQNAHYVEANYHLPLSLAHTYTYSHMHAQYYLNICYFKWTLYLLCQNYPFKTGKNTSNNPLGISASPSHLCSSPNLIANSYGYYSVTSQRTNLKFPFGFISCLDPAHLRSFYQKTDLCNNFIEHFYKIVYQTFINSSDT